ncbi:MAG: hypothetical protein ACRCTZ_16145 [Sarcina sp.]
MVVNTERLKWLLGEYEQKVKNFKSLCSLIENFDCKSWRSLNLSEWSDGIVLDKDIAVACLKLQFEKEYSRYKKSLEDISKYVKINNGEVLDLYKVANDKLDNMQELLKTESVEINCYETTEYYDFEKNWEDME